MAIDANYKGAIGDGARHAHEHITLPYLPDVERDLTALVDLSVGELGRAGDATAIFAAIGQIEALFGQGIKQRTAGIALVGGAAAIGDGYGAGPAHSQMSLVQSPPG